MADARASKARDRKIMWVQLPPPAPFNMPKLKLPSRNYKWSPELAYIVGLLATDGNLSKDGRHINMRSSDKDLLKTFKTCLKLNNKIAQSVNDGYAKKPSFRIQFSNIQFYHWLLKIGLFPAKTYTIGKIKIPNLYFRDFLRGHLDGDGSVYTYIDKYNNYRGRNYINQRVYVKFISASQAHINWLHEGIKRLSRTKGSLQCNRHTKTNRVPIWEIKFSKKESLQLLNWIYYQENLPCLERKKKLVMKILDLLATEKRKIYTLVHREKEIR